MCNKDYRSTITELSSAEETSSVFKGIPPLHISRFFCEPMGIVRNLCNFLFACNLKNVNEQDSKCQKGKLIYSESVKWTG
jgi:hypothetical protein